VKFGKTGCRSVDDFFKRWEDLLDRVSFPDDNKDGFMKETGFNKVANACKDFF